MSKRIIALLLALVMVFALCACGNGGNGGNSAGTEDVGDETYTIRIACENSDSYPATLGLYQMEKYVESHTNGKVQVMEPVRDPQKALEHAMALTGKACPKVLFYPRPQTGLPYIK